jgi:hypothetical protein
MMSLFWFSSDFLRYKKNSLGVLATQQDDCSEEHVGVEMLLTTVLTLDELDSKLGDDSSLKAALVSFYFFCYQI